MKFIKCFVSSFGNLKNFTYNFNDGLNVIIQDNGFGKSTFANFIKCIFYGLNDGKRSVANNERIKFKPWNSNEKFGGYVIFETKKGQFRLERFFGSKNSEDEVRLFDNSTGKQLANVENIGHKLFGIDEEGFLATLYFSEKDVVIKDNSSLTAKYNLTINVDSIDDADAVIERIKTRAKDYKYSGERGLIWESDRKINALEFKLSECEKSERTASELLARINQLQLELIDLNKQIQIISDKITLAGKQEAVKVKKERVQYIKGQLAKATENYNQAKAVLCGKNVTTEHLDACKKIVDDIKIACSKLNTLEQDINVLEKQKSQASNSAQTTVSGVLLALALVVCLAGFGLIFATDLKLLGGICCLVGLVCLAVWIVLTNKPKSNPVLEQQIANKTADFNQTSQIINQNNSKLLDFFVQFGLQNYEPLQAIEILRQSILNAERYSVETNDYQTQLSALLVDEDLNISVGEVEDVNLLKAKLNALNNEYFAKSNTIAVCKTDLTLLEKNVEAIADIESSLYDEKENKTNLENQLNVLSLTYKFLSQANENQKIRYREPLTTAFNKYLSILSDGKTSAEIDVDFEITVDEKGSKKVVDYYSKGYNGLFNSCRRFALVDVLYPTDKPFVILDDPFMSFDQQKISNTLNVVKDFAKQTQVIYLTCHDSRTIK